MLAFILPDSLFMENLRQVTCLSLYLNCFCLVIQSSYKLSLPGKCYLSKLMSW